MFLVIMTALIIKVTVMMIMAMIIVMTPPLPLPQSLRPYFSHAPFTLLTPSACLGHPLLRIGLPLLNETAVSYWWPGQDVEFVHFEGNGLAMTPHVPQVKRNRWHKLVLQSSFSPEDEFMMQHRGEMEMVVLCFL